MGTIVFILAALIEITLAVYCIATKSNQKRTRSWIRIGTFATFFFFTLISVIEWSFQWKLLAATLLIWAIIGVVSLIRKKEEKKEPKRVGIIFKALAMLLILIIAMAPALMFPQYEPPQMTGSYEVATAVYTYTDDSRIETFNNSGQNRKVTAQFWYPADKDGTYPLVVFSHGAFGIKDSNTSTYMELASHGYVVASLDHPHHSMYTVDTEGKFTMVDTSFIQEVIDVNKGIYDEETVFELTHKWLEVRTQDMNFVLDTIIENTKNTDSDEVYQLIDTNKIGLMGHSLGGAASAQVGRDRDDVRAVINLDGDLLGENVDFRGGKYVINDKIYPLPILNIYTDDMMKLFAAAHDAGYIDANTLILDTAPKAFMVNIKGTNHMSLTDLPLFSPMLVSMISNSVSMGGGVEADKYYIIETMNTLVLEFFDCYLKGEGDFDSEGTY
ncbi:acetylhydrolase [Paenibacillus anaericanus]|uniref:Acetylhydrolase n=1 Tax=Paenibacillus anaericanus TaxID=170367 RepID=A0A3S1BNX5_9BACL|nr:acetylhydrolase [Paenibacillus anaericanus]RUT46080.1 acetylhydrolase [Paenibacillus anaericanus]